jgi:RNA polymerase sigma-70 factor (ECF subfamily)
MLLHRPHAQLDADRALRHLDRLYGYALSITGDSHEAEDLVQDVLESLLRRPRRIRAGDNENAYLYTMLRNRHFDRLRAKARRPQVEFEQAGVEPEARSGESPAERAEQRAVLDAVAELPLDYRETLVAVDVAGLSYREAATMLDVPLGTVMSRLHRARANVVAAVTATAEPRLRRATPVLAVAGVG